MAAIRAGFKLDRAGFVLDVDLELPGRGVTALFGPSGSGKTTLLRCIAGLERVPGGKLSVNGALWQGADTFVPTHRRPLGYVFQEASLFPHLSVRRNLEYGMKRVPPALRRGNLEASIELLGIGALLERATDGLSGGERQRVAIARALAVSPQLLLLDEPLASLDLARKQEILPYLQRLHDDLEIPVLYVSHAPDEVARLADHVVLLEHGSVVAQGGVQATLARLDLAGAFADDMGVVIDATIAAQDDTDHLTRLDFEGGSVHVSRCIGAPGARMRFRIQARDVSLAVQRPERTSILNLFEARIVEVADATVPGQVLVKLEVGRTPLVARISGRSRRELRIEPGQSVWAQVKSVAVLR
ncbi:MAG: molybdenum ABC transporter ATP-binding protein [Burkholderiaceae bacterium]|nr:molybdenum ABC transporter ATP-binding protein [Burkholderiaceae bacterium]